MGSTKGAMPQDVFVEEYQDFQRMGLSTQEIAQAFGCSMDALYHRLKRCGLPVPLKPRQHPEAWWCK